MVNLLGALREIEDIEKVKSKESRDGEGAGA